MLDFNDRAASQGLRVGQRLFNCLNRARGNSGSGKLLEPYPRRALGQKILQNGIELVAVLHPQSIRRKARIAADRLFRAKNGNKPRPVRFAADRND